MATRSHKILQTKAAGLTGRIIDAISGTGILREIERHRQHIPLAINKLKEGLDEKVGRKAEIWVFWWNDDYAIKEARRHCLRCTVVIIGFRKERYYVAKKRQSTGL